MHDVHRERKVSGYIPVGHLQVDPERVRPATQLRHVVGLVQSTQGHGHFMHVLGV